MSDVIGKFFKLGANKAPKVPRKDYDGNSRSSSDCSDDEDGYMDPATVHPTSSPTNLTTAPVERPSYPPPRPTHSPAARRVQDSSKRASVPVTFGQTTKGPHPRPQRPISAEHLQAAARKPYPMPRTAVNMAAKMQRDDYSDPWDAKKVKSPAGDYSDPWDAKKKAARDDYLEPWDATKKPPADDYCDPWDQNKSAGSEAGKVKKATRDDYIDPWDATKAAQTQAESTQKPADKAQHCSTDSDDESYTEPYDMHKITMLDEQAKRLSLRGMRPSASMDETSSVVHEEKKTRKNSDEVFGSGIKKFQSPSKDMRPADDYDSPWESKSLLMMKQKSLDLPSNKPQAPVKDTRPAEDYDKPWEWTKKPTAFNGHTPTPTPRPQEPLQSPTADAREACDYDAPWEWSKNKELVSMVQGKEGGAQSGNSAPPPKPPRVFAEDESPVDPSLPLEQQGWYHGPLKRVEAEKILRSAEDCSFLVRNSESSKKDFSLSVRNNNSFMHLKIVCGENGYVLGQFSKPFDTVAEVIHHYSINKLNIRGAEHKKLLYPLVQGPEYFTLEPAGYYTPS